MLATEPSLERSKKRFPLRTRWSLFGGLIVALALSSVLLLVLDSEGRAWERSQLHTARVLVNNLEQLSKIAAISGNRSELDFILNGVLKRTDNILAIYIVLKSDARVSVQRGTFWEPSDQGMQRSFLSFPEAERVEGHPMWFVKTMTYHEKPIGWIAVRFSGAEWLSVRHDLIVRIVIAGAFVLLLFLVIVGFLTRSMTQPLEALAKAAEKVADGDFKVQLKIEGNDEITDASLQFNRMVQELDHKQQMRGIFGRYLNPKVVDQAFSADGEHLPSSRQEVSVLFADMVSFTPFSEHTPTEEVISVLNQYFQAFHSIISEAEGNVDKYIGDAIMAVFNHPIENEHHIRQATLVGLAMVEVSRRLGLRRYDGDLVAFRIGIATGSAIIGNIGAQERMEYTVIGHTVNVAARMGGLGHANEVVMTQECFQKLGDGFRFGNLGPLAVKGVEEKMVCGVVHADSPTLQKWINITVQKALESYT